MVVFLCPTERDLSLMHSMLDLFAAASGLHTNVQKCQYTPIRCSDEDLHLVAQIFPGQLQHFLCRYLGIPLPVSKVPKSEIQALVDVVGNRLSTWKSKLLNKAGRVALAKSTLAAIPIHLSIIMGLQPWAISAIEKLMKAFVWQGTSTVATGKCMVAWEKVCHPKDMGGLGIPNLKMQGHALRMRWEWLKRTDQSRTWLDLPDTPDRVAQQFFAASITCSLGDGHNIFFWTDKWLDGKSIEQIAPCVLNAVPTQIRKTRTVRDALQNDQWIHDISGPRTVPLIRQFL